MKKADYSGLAGFARTTNKASGTTLTEKTLNDFVKLMKSKKYLKMIEENNLGGYKGEMIVSFAHQQNIINEAEYYDLLFSIQMNGFLLVSPKMGKRLEKVKLPKKWADVESEVSSK